ncbi:hypothetical protein IFM89_018921 [Coptis chinensis]|uniref:Bifunctional inhibitor/plant lipid transfer protein/seed storage helical domain-containing protein n=1 Tax=Coptis chinensis TaxID=261450 RepID=A0A835LJT7_9MAGN|nr:hypothetical protein IFM89_018921 [Coptis chinensis]
MFIKEQKMESSMKYICILGLLVITGFAGMERADGKGECGKESPDNVAFKLAPCASAAKDANAAVSNGCCSQIKIMGQNPSCLCAVLLSNTAKMAGVDLATAITIPKRCNLANRPVGMKCGDYTLP